MDTELRPQIRLSDAPPDLNTLIDDWFRYGDRRTHVKVRSVIRYDIEELKCPGHLRGTERNDISIYTDNNEYRLTAFWGLGQKGYLGCIASSRKPRAGEEHTRGSDLSDGPFTYETWFRILADIVSYELVTIAKSARPVADGRPFPSHVDNQLPENAAAPSVAGEPQQENADVEGRQPRPQPFPPAARRGQGADAPAPSDGSR